jgi:hypothetical protein
MLTVGKAHAPHGFGDMARFKVFRRVHSAEVYNTAPIHGNDDKVIGDRASIDGLTLADSPRVLWYVRYPAARH